jgi:hypothetical protein
MNFCAVSVSDVFCVLYVLVILFCFYITGCKKWWNWGTRFPESKLACEKFLETKKKIVETLVADMSADI